MADQKDSPGDPQPLEEAEFLRVLAEIGGKERIFLVTDAYEGESGKQPCVFTEFLKDVFHAACVDTPSSSSSATQGAGDANASTHHNGTASFPSRSDERKSGDENEPGSHCAGNRAPHTPWTPKPKAEPSPAGRPGELDDRPPQGRREHPATSKTCPAGERPINFALIVFLFRHEFVNSKGNKMRLKEILKDVRGRSRGAGERPAVLGLLHASAESGETHQSVRDLDHMLRSVFRKQPRESVWVGPFIPNNTDGTLEIKRNLCKALQASLCTDDDKGDETALPGVLQCFPWCRTNQRRCDHSTSVNRRQG
ncbi:uncharacterized protein C2orf72 isoform X2 [Amia ocellicauda]|uniref:uncharacterized protein C2orf72 isoform X2 n=1 Tax=Amia ocellicauda TaxID=2972642 RepID=UPI0034643555